MTFAWPHLLWLIALPLALLIWEGFRGLRTQRQANHAKIIRAQAGANRILFSGTEEVPSKRKLPRFWLGIGLMLAIIALARPQWGRIEEQVFDQSREIILAVDLSKSMNAPDVKPSRLDRSKLLIRSLLDRLAGERVGLIVFSGTAFLQSPLSTDYEILGEFLPELKSGYLPEGGTNFQKLLQTAVEAFGTASNADRYLIILSDGEALDDNWKSMLKPLTDKNVKIIALGVGTSEGAMIPEAEGGFVKDERGAVVMSRLSSDTLQQLASATKGVYRDASSWVDLPDLLRKTIEAGQKGVFSEKREARPIERFQWVLGPALFCLLASLFFEFPARIKPRQLIATVAGAAKATQVTTALVFCAFLGAAFAGGSTPLGAAEAPPPDSPLVSTVRRLAAKNELKAGDCAELAKRTIDWGKGLQSSQQPVAEGPIRDGLSAVDSGEALNPKAADWPALRRELEQLSRKQEQPKQDQQKQDQPQQNQNKQNQQQQDSKDQQKQDQQQQQQNSSKDQQKQQEQKQEEQKDRKQQQESQQKESAFGDMKQEPEKQEPRQAPQPQQEEMQTIGNKEKKPASEKGDPNLVVPLEKLEKIKNQDSPGRLFQLMEGEKTDTQPANKKNW